jgi:hypothetical protein
MKKTQKADPVAYGDPTVSTKRKPRRASMSALSKSKWIKQDTPNQWQEILLSEDNMRLAIEYALVQLQAIPKHGVLERVIVGELAKGLYPVSIAISQGREV